MFQYRETKGKWSVEHPFKAVLYIRTGIRKKNYQEKKFAKLNKLLTQKKKKKSMRKK